VHSSCIAGVSLVQRTVTGAVQKASALGSMALKSEMADEIYCLSYMTIVLYNFLRREQGNRSRNRNGK
jgi:hypothetical protein